MFGRLWALVYGVSKRLLLKELLRILRLLGFARALAGFGSPL